MTSPPATTLEPSLTLDSDAVEHTATTQATQLQHEGQQHEPQATTHAHGIVVETNLKASSRGGSVSTAGSTSHTNSPTSPDLEIAQRPLPFVAPSHYLRKRSTDNAIVERKHSHEQHTSNLRIPKPKPMSPLDQEQLEALVSECDEQSSVMIHRRKEAVMDLA